MNFMVSPRACFPALGQYVSPANGTAMPTVIFARFLRLVAAPIAADAIIGAFSAHSATLFLRQHFHDALLSFFLVPLSWGDGPAFIVSIFPKDSETPNAKK